MAKNDGAWTTTRETVTDMNLRDIYTVMLLPIAYRAQLEAAMQRDWDFTKLDVDVIARECGRMADAMLAEREKGNETETG